MSGVILILVLCLFTQLTGCKKSEEEVIRDAYFKDYEEAYKLVEQIETRTHGNEMYQENYKNIIHFSIPKAETVLKRYEKTSQRDRDSYKYLIRAIDSFVEANSFWKERKGLFLVYRRLADGRDWLDKAEDAFFLETGQTSKQKQKDELKSIKAHEKEQAEKSNEKGEH